LSISGNWDRRLSRRTFLGLGGMSAAVLMLGTKGVLSQTSGSAGYGELVPDPGGLIDLPKGFQYRIISEEGSPLSREGVVLGVVPGDHDGMAAFRGPSSGTAVLVRNHEQRVGDPNPLVGANPPYDPAAPGGTTGIVVNLEDRTEISDYVTSSGTLNNCAGGATPWGTWLTCEEDRTTGHGYVFEVDPNDPENELSRTPIRGMGFFSHEAVDIDPATGIAYLTEDDFRGSIPDDPNDEIVADVPDTEGGRGTRVSFLYRYIPNDLGQRPGALQQGGRLQVMTLNRTDLRAGRQDLLRQLPESRYNFRHLGTVQAARYQASDSDGRRRAAGVYEARGLRRAGRGRREVRHEPARGCSLRPARCVAGLVITSRKSASVGVPSAASRHHGWEERRCVVCG
jgi:uncharacterized protein